MSSPRALRPLDYIREFVRRSVGRLVGPHITLNVIFSAVCERIDLKFGGDLHVYLLFQFLLFIFLSFSSN
jgi:heme A synthase